MATRKFIPVQEAFREWDKNPKFREAYNALEDEFAREAAAIEARMNDGHRMKDPPHLGSFLRTELTQGRGLSVSQAAAALRVLRPTLSAVLNGRASLSPEVALRMEKAFGLSMDTLMRMQCEYDIAQARQREPEIDVPPYETSIKPGSQGSLL